MLTLEPQRLGRPWNLIRTENEDDGDGKVPDTLVVGGKTRVPLYPD